MDKLLLNIRVSRNWHDAVYHDNVARMLAEAGADADAPLFDGLVWARWLGHPMITNIGESTFGYGGYVDPISLTDSAIPG